MIKMKALRSFGVHGANEGKVRRGRELVAASERRARDLEIEGLAYRIDVKPSPDPVNRLVPTPSNKAADAGPFVSPGGTTGAIAPVPSSPPARQPRRRRSRQSGTQDLLSSPSRNVSDSSLKPTSPMAATGLGGS